MLTLGIYGRLSQDLLETYVFERVRRHKPHNVSLLTLDLAGLADVVDDFCDYYGHDGAFIRVNRSGRRRFALESALRQLVFHSDEIFLLDPTKTQFQNVEALCHSMHKFLRVVKGEKIKEYNYGYDFT